MQDDWIPPLCIIRFGQPIGTAVAVTFVHHLEAGYEPTFFSDMVLAISFVDVKLLDDTYRLALTILSLDPITRFPSLPSFLSRYIINKWSSKDEITEFVRWCEDRNFEISSQYHPRERGPVITTSLRHIAIRFSGTW